MLIESIENELWEKELWTQKAVANYFRVVQGTVKNWRDQGSCHIGRLLDHLRSFIIDMKSRNLEIKIQL